MSATIQVLMLVVGVLLSALVTALISQISGLRSDIKAWREEQQTDHDLLLTISAEHKARLCSKGVS